MVFGLSSRCLCFGSDNATLKRMIVDVLTRSTVRQPFERRSTGEHEGAVGEERLLLSGVSWEQYMELDEALGHDRAGPRVYYLESELEIMTTSLQHERLKKWLGGLVEDYLLEAGVRTFPHGQATMRLLKEAGAEPDESWCFGREKRWPELVLEVALTSGGLDKLEIYQRFAVSEVWLWRKGALEIYSLRQDRSGYDGPVRRSCLLPDLDVTLVERCVQRKDWRAARLAFRASLRRPKH